MDVQPLDVVISDKSVTDGQKPKKPKAKHRDGGGWLTIHKTQNVLDQDRLFILFYLMLWYLLDAKTKPV